MQIIPFIPTYQQQVESLVLGVQNGEFGLGLTAQDQPDLPDLAAFYTEGAFWIAVNGNDEVVGTIGLQPIGNEQAVLRKMFLAKSVRGDKSLNLAQRLFDMLVAEARGRNLKELWLDTPLMAHAAHRFYERNGFGLVPLRSVPSGFKLPAVKELKIYKLTI